MAARIKKPFVIDSTSQRSRMKVYEPLVDPHLTNYFGSPVIRKTLRKGGLVTTRGEVVQRGYNPRAPRIMLPPLAFVTVQPKTAGVRQFASSKHSSTSTGRLWAVHNNGENKDDKIPATMVKRKSESTSDLSKKREGRKKQLPSETVKKQPWVSSSVKPLTHEEYEEMLQRFCIPEESERSQHPNKSKPTGSQQPDISAAQKPDMSQTQPMESHPQQHPPKEHEEQAAAYPSAEANPVQEPVPGVSGKGESEPVEEVVEEAVEEVPDKQVPDQHTPQDP